MQIWPILFNCSDLWLYLGIFLNRDFFEIDVLLAHRQQFKMVICLVGFNNNFSFLNTLNTSTKQKDQKLDVKWKGVCRVLRSYDKLWEKSMVSTKETF